MIVVNFDPVIFELGPLQVRWYGLMYVIGFLLGGKLLTYLSQKKEWPVPKEKVDLFVTINLIGMFFGARLFYVFVYNWDYYSQNLSELLSVWKGGLSFHGAIIGFCIATYLYARKGKYPFLRLTDAISLAGSPGLFFGRMGNFINGELYGRPTDVPWGMIFSGAGPYPRHPSQLYEGVLEGIILCLFLWAVRKRFAWNGAVTSLFFAGYGVMRFIVEFFREPDAQLGLYFNNLLSMGQILCFLMVIVGLTMFFLTKRAHNNKLVGHHAS